MFQKMILRPHTLNSFLIENKQGNHLGFTLTSFHKQNLALSLFKKIEMTPFADTKGDG